MIKFSLVAILFCLVIVVHGAPQQGAPQGYDPRFAQNQPQQQPPPQQQDPRYAQPQQGYDPRQQQPPPQQGPPQPPPPPQINWGKCPQLEPSQEEKMKKATVITKCLEMTPIPRNITRETVEYHREQVAACALQMEGWFDANNAYRFDKAESEIRSKKLDGNVEKEVLAYHAQCKSEAEQKFPAASGQLIAQIQLYQACMDYFISEACGIQVGGGAGAQSQPQAQQAPPPQAQGNPNQYGHQQQPPTRFQ